MTFLHLAVRLDNLNIVNNEYIKPVSSLEVGRVGFYFVNRSLRVVVNTQDDSGKS